MAAGGWRNSVRPSSVTVLATVVFAVQLEVQPGNVDAVATVQVDGQYSTRVMMIVLVPKVSCTLRRELMASSRAARRPESAFARPPSARDVLIMPGHAPHGHAHDNHADRDGEDQLGHREAVFLCDSSLGHTVTSIEQSRVHRV
jgi:hypothetical protein